MPARKLPDTTRPTKFEDLDLSQSTTPIFFYDALSERITMNAGFEKIEVLDGVHRAEVQADIIDLVTAAISEMKPSDQMSLVYLSDKIQRDLVGIQNCVHIARISVENPDTMIAALMRTSTSDQEDRSIVRGSNSSRAEAQFMVNSILLESTERMTRMFHSIDFLEMEQMSSTARREVKVLKEQLDEAMGVLDRMGSLMGPPSNQKSPPSNELPADYTRVDDSFLNRACALSRDTVQVASLEFKRQSNINEIIALPESKVMGLIMGLTSRADGAVAEKQAKKGYSGQISIDFKIKKTPSIVFGKRERVRKFLCLSFKDNGELLTAEQHRACLSSVGDINSMSEGTLALFSANSMVCSMGGTMIITDNKRGSTTVELQFPVVEGD